MNPLSDIVILLFSETAQIEAIKQQMSQEISDLRKEKVKLQHTASDRLQTEHVKMHSAFYKRICLRMTDIILEMHLYRFSMMIITWGFIYRCS